MGGGVSVEVLPDQESIAKPGSGKVIMSASMEEHGVDYVSFLNELMSFLSLPPPMSEAVMKDKKYEEIPEGNPDEFKFKVTLDGEKMLGYSFGDGSDKIVINRHVKVSRQDRTIECWEYNDKDDPDKLSTNSLTTFLDSPFRLEAYLIDYRENPDGLRVSDESVVKIWKDAFIDPICTTIVKTKVKCQSDQPSLSGSGELVVVSDRLDEYVSCEALIDCLIPLAKETAETAAGPDDKPDFQEENGGAVHNLTVTTPFIDPTNPEEKKNAIIDITLNKETKEYQMVLHMGGKHVHTRCMHVHWPRVESYMINAQGERISGGSYVRDFGRYINQVVAKAEASSGLFAGWFS